MPKLDVVFNKEYWEAVDQKKNVRCWASTQSDTQCKNRARDGLFLCSTHVRLAEQGGKTRRYNAPVA